MKFHQMEDDFSAASVHAGTEAGKGDAMQEHDRSDGGGNVIEQSLELMLIALGLVVMRYLGLSLLMPMAIGLALFLVILALQLVQRLRKRSGR